MIRDLALAFLVLVGVVLLLGFLWTVRAECQGHCGGTCRLDMPGLCGAGCVCMATPYPNVGQCYRTGGVWDTADRELMEWHRIQADRRHELEE